jgi:hypothetical protein
MTDTLGKIKEFVTYARSLKGYEKGEAQVFCDRLFKRLVIEDTMRQEQSLSIG